MPRPAVRYCRSSRNSAYCVWLLVQVAVTLVLLHGTSPAADAEPKHRVFPQGVFPPDVRLASARTLRDAYHPWTPPESLEAWEAERNRIRTQLLVACGLWPMPSRTPLEPVIHGRVERDGYTIERVFFASRPGLYVTGSLYRPIGFEGRRPGILSPHGHWAEGRFYDAGDREAARQIEQGAETFPSAAHSPLQARMAQLARMGCVVFHYDMIGYADQGPLDHRRGFSGVEAELWSQNILGLQTWNSIRALDFLASLPDVDPERIGVTGASGGGTQTFVLCAIDPRPAVAFPAVMVSTGMQGGCVCENASHLRVGLNNVAFAACCAPRPLAMSGANDWTIEIESKGLPELKQIWSLYDQPDLVQAKCFPEFGHNYNQVARGLMYAWFNEHLQLGQAAPIVEEDFVPLSRAEMTVFTAEHPRPDDALPAELLLERLIESARMEFAELVEQARTDPSRYREVIAPAAEVLFGGLPAAEELTGATLFQESTADVRIERGACGRDSDGSQIPWVRLSPAGVSQGLAVWIDGRGKQGLFDGQGAPIAGVRELLKQGLTVVSADVFLTGEFLPVEVDVSPTVHPGFAGYTWGYNRPLIAERVRDILTVAAYSRRETGLPVKRWIGTREAGPWILFVRGVVGTDDSETTADIGEFSFSRMTSTRDPDFLPGALRFGGLGGILALAGPAKVVLYGGSQTVMQELDPFAALGGIVEVGRGRLLPSRDE